ncbi:YfhO family protein [Embleya scabrispora]|uniref:YfhO family protein n=1 Tax=Embleya scabrispora TaxID=159449 RepID=UPI0003A0A2EC|nr:YfhO family protein [Embleya scabrispora]MYS79943.1 YfhO family protein [Streptomyces sp. SID5474]
MQKVADGTPAGVTDIGDPGEPAGPGLRRGFRLRRFAIRLSGPLLAFVATVTAYCTAWVARGVYPFGDIPRGVNDLANQYVPFHQNLWDLAHGQAAGDPFFNWRSGFGQQFLSDYHTYLGNPVSLIAILVPREHVDFAVYLVSPLTMGIAAAAMTVYLKHLAPGSRWMRAALGVAYALCGWSVSDASYIPMWTWGLVSLPLIGLAVEWCIQGRRWVGATAFVAIAWTGNYYTAIMATLAGGILLLIRLATLDVDWRRRVDATVRAGSAFMLGAAVTLPLLLPSYLSSKASQPTEAGEFVAERSEIFFASMLPATHLWGGRPKLYIASLGMILALAFLANRAVAPRTRAVWGGAMVLLAASFQWSPTQYLWHGLAVPNGNPYRETFVFSAMLAMLAWMCLANRPGMLPVAGAALSLVLLTFLVRDVDDFGRYTWWAVLGGGGISVFALWLLKLSRPDMNVGRMHRRDRGRPLLMIVATVLMVGVVVAESAMATAVADVRRGRERWAWPVATSGTAFDNKFRATGEADGWPRYRTDTGTQYFAYNDPLRMRGEGPEYYSSYTPKVTFDALAPLGYGWMNGGRTIFGADNPVLDAIFSVGARVRPTNAAATRFEASRFSTTPLVTVHPGGNAPTGTAFDSVYARQEAVLGSTVYQVPTPVVSGQETAISVTGTGPYRLAPRESGTTLTFTAKCTPGNGVYWYSPTLYGPVNQNGAEALSEGSTGDAQAGVVPVGTVPASGIVEVKVSTTADADIPARPIGCLDPGLLAKSVRQLTTTGATAVSVGGHSIEARLPAGSTGTAVIATTATDGWVCSRQGGAMKKPDNRYGLIAIPVEPGTTRIACSFTPPGLRAGLAGGGAALLAVLAVPATVWLRQRRNRKTPAGVDTIG